MNLKTITKSKKNLAVINLVLLVGLVLSFGVNQVISAKVYDSLGIKNSAFKKITSSILKSTVTSNVALAGKATEDAVKLTVSTGVPDIYGAELGISFDDVQAALNVMKKFGPTNGKNKITLTGTDKQRYIDIGLKIACEYCCGAKGLVRSNGDAACGCAHSQAMRGLAAYLIQNHGAEYTDDEILRELARWKGMYFPKQMIKKLTSQLQGADFTPDTASLVMGIDLPDYGQGSSSAPLPSDLKDLPDMVGGC